MKCADARKNIYLRLDGELAESLKAGLEEHLRTCLACGKEAASIQNFQAILRKAPSRVEPSLDFEANFWKKAYAREKEPQIVRIFEQISFLIPTPSLAQAAAVLLVALLIGGAGGVVSAMSPPAPVKSLSGFQEIKGIPTSSIAGSYLAILPSENKK